MKAKSGEVHMCMHSHKAYLTFRTCIVMHSHPLKLHPLTLSFA